MKSKQTFLKIGGDLHDLMEIKPNEDWSIFAWRIPYHEAFNDISLQKKNLFWVPINSQCYIFVNSKKPKRLKDMADV